MCQYFTSLEPWRELLAGDFNRGYLTGVLLVLAVVLVLLLCRIVLGIVFRTRRARSILIAAPDGEVQVAQNAISAAVDCMLTDFPELALDSLKIYRRGSRRYSLSLQCRFQAGGKAFPDIAAQLKKAIFDGLKTQFGIDNLQRIRIVLTEWERPDGAPRKPVTPAEAVPPVPETGTDML